jgi:hypothetical protein
MTHVRAVTSIALTLAAFEVLVRALHWMNQPSDRGWYGGIAVILILVLLLPFVFRMIWRKL